MFKKLFVASIVIIAFLSLSYSIHSFANEEESTNKTVDYSGGLIDSRIGQKGIGVKSYDLKKDEITTATDNDEATYHILERYDSGATRMDHLLFSLTEPAKIGYIRLKTDNPDSQINVYFLNSSDQILKTYTATVKDGTLEKLPEDISLVDVSKVAIHNKSTTDVNIMEFNVYSTIYTEEPTTEEPTTEEPTTEEPTTEEPTTDSKNVHLRIQMVDGFEREYFLTTKEAADFENWLGKRLNDEGAAIYTFKNKELPRTENLVYDKIVYYEITDL